MTSHSQPAPIDFEGAPIVVIPVGSWEQHGPHLPFDTDTRIAEALVDDVIQKLPQLRRGPTVTVGASGEHAGFSGTLSIGTETTAQVMIEIARSAIWSSGVVFVNGHGGNLDAVNIARRCLRAEGRRVLFWSPSSDDQYDTHAGHIETSVMMTLAPETVLTDRLQPGTRLRISENLEHLRVRGVIGVSPNGILGDPRTANAEDGRRILSSWSESLQLSLEQWLHES